MQATVAANRRRFGQHVAPGRSRRNTRAHTRTIDRRSLDRRGYLADRLARVAAAVGRLGLALIGTAFAWFALTALGRLEHRISPADSEGGEY
nr:MAG: hypothetical protein DIU56_05705 [Pseudomonadota bacterium]